MWLGSCFASPNTACEGIGGPAKAAEPREVKQSAVRRVDDAERNKPFVG